MTALTVQGVTVPGLQTRRAETTLEMNSGQTFADGASLIDTRVDAPESSRRCRISETFRLSALFCRSAQYQNAETEMLVLVTASLVGRCSVATTPLDRATCMSSPTIGSFTAWAEEGKTTAKLSTVDAEYFRSTGLDRLKGPGAVETYETPRATSTASLSGSTSAESNGTAIPNRSEQ